MVMNNFQISNRFPKYPNCEKVMSWILFLEDIVILVSPRIYSALQELAGLLTLAETSTKSPLPEPFSVPAGV